MLIRWPVHWHKSAGYLMEVIGTPDRCYTLLI